MRSDNTAKHSEISIEWTKPNKSNNFKSLLFSKVEILHILDHEINKFLINTLIYIISSIQINSNTVISDLEGKLEWCSSPTIYI